MKFHVHETEAFGFAMIGTVIIATLCALAQEGGRPYQGYDDLGDVTPERGIVLEHPPGGYELFMFRARPVFDTENEISMVTGTNVLTLADFSWIKSNGMVEVLVYSFSDGRQDHSETNLFRVTLRRPSTAPKARAVILATNQTRKFKAPPAPAPSFGIHNGEDIRIESFGGSSRVTLQEAVTVPSSGPLPVMTPEQWGEGRAKMKAFYERVPRRGTNPISAGGLKNHTLNQ